MANFTDEVMSLAGVYADSLLRVARQQGVANQVAEEFRDLIQYMDQHPDFDRFMSSSTVDDDARRASLDKMFRGKLNDLLLSMLQVLNTRHRSDLVRQVGRAVELKTQEDHHSQEVVIETAAPLPEDLKARVKEVLSKRIGKEPLLIEKIRPELIGGIVIYVGDQRLDASLLTTIRSMRARLATRSGAEIHRNDGKYVEN